MVFVRTTNAASNPEPQGRGGGGEPPIPTCDQNLLRPAQANLSRLDEKDENRLV